DNWAETVNTVISVFCMTVLGALALSLHYMKEQNRLYEETITDPLTGLKNRRALQLIYSDRSIDASVAIAMFDLDHFKRTNDIFGHPFGDMVLKRFADLLRDSADRSTDVFRLGGEEFCA